MKSGMLFFTLFLAVFVGVLNANEVQIPRSVQGDKGQYYLLEIKKNGKIIETVHKRVGVDSIGFSKTKINCAAKQYKDIGYGEDSQKNIKNYPSAEWTDIVQGSSKSDLVNFVCKK